MKCAATMLSIVLILATCTGCPNDKRTSVTLVIAGDANLVHDLMSEVLRRLVDNPETYSVSSSRWFDGPTTVTISPVNDIDRFRARLSFGDITKLEGRSIHLTLDPNKTKTWIAISKISTLVKGLPDYVRWELFMLRYRIKAWISGKSIATVFWETVTGR